MLQQHGLYHIFSAFAISEIVGVEKPDISIFEVAVNKLGLTLADADRIVMVGNRLDRDVRGANQAGMISVWLNWSPRYAKQPRDPLESPRFTIDTPLELLDVIDALESDVG